MKVNTSNNPQRVVVNDLRDTNKARGPQQGKSAEASTQFEPSHSPDASHDIDSARVNEVRQAITEGRLQLNADRIADGIIASARELTSNR